jgi:hypothetical protein
MRGRVLTSSSGIEIEVNEDLDEPTQQFTIAHEIAHLILEKQRIAVALTEGQNVKRYLTHSLIERLCDACAAEILLPEKWLENELRQRRGALEHILKIAFELDLTPEFVASRIIDLQLRPWRALLCKDVHGNLQITKSIPDWDDTFLVSVSILSLPDTPIRTYDEKPNMSTGRLALRIHGEAMEYPAQCLRQDDGTIFCVLHIGRPF